MTDYAKRLQHAKVPELLQKLGATPGVATRVLGQLAYIPKAYDLLEKRRRATERRAKLGRQFRALAAKVEADRVASVTSIIIEDDRNDADGYLVRFVQCKLANRPTLADLLRFAADDIEDRGPYSFEPDSIAIRSRYTWRSVCKILLLFDLLPVQHRRNKVVADIASAILRKPIKGNDIAKDAWLQDALSPPRRNWKMVNIPQR